MKHYVKVSGGRVVDGPKILSTDNNAAPNTEWPLSQLKAHGYFLVSLECDELTQYIDLANPTITEDSVTYPVLQKPNSEVLSVVKKRRIQIFRDMAYTIVQSKYDLEEQIVGSLGLLPTTFTNQMKTDIQKVMDVFLKAKSDVQAAQNRQQVESISPVWPEI